MFVFYFVGLPDKLDVWPSNRLPMPLQIHPIPPNAKVLSAYWTPIASTLIPLSKLLIYIIFKDSKV